MSSGPWDIDAIVREVLRRLEQFQSAAPDHLPPVPNPDPTHQERGELRLGERVVTMATVDGRLRGIHRLIVNRSAVITPSVRDLLKRQEISLLREETTRPGRVRPISVTITAAETDYDPNRLVARLGAGAARTEPIRTAVAHAAAETREKTGLCVLLTGRTALALCLANRHGALRAALGCSVDMVREAKRSIGANLIVLDPAGATDDELAEIVREFTRDAPHECPLELRAGQR